MTLTMKRCWYVSAYRLSDRGEIKTVSCQYMAYRSEDAMYQHRNKHPLDHISSCYPVEVK